MRSSRIGRRGSSLRRFEWGAEFAKLRGAKQGRARIFTSGGAGGNSPPQSLYEALIRPA
jgi:hypothetical protein